MARKKKNKGDFTTGFLLGTMAGVTGYLLASSDQGKETLDKLKQEWQVAEKELSKKGILSSKKTAHEMINVIFKKITDQIDSVHLEKKRLIKSSLNKEKKVKKKQKAPKKFKGLS